METTKVISENENYTAVNIGSMDELMEHTLVHPVSGRIIEKLFEQFPCIERIELRLSKRNPPMGADIESAGIELQCSRDE